MSENLHTRAAELHTQAAYAHVAAEFEHSTGDHISAEDLDKRAYERSVRAVQLSQEIVKHEPESLKL